MKRNHARILLAVYLAVDALAGGIAIHQLTQSAQPMTTPPAPTEAPAYEMAPQGPYLIEVKNPRLAPLVADAVSTWEQGTGATIQDPMAFRVLSVSTTRSEAYMGIAFRGVAAKSSVNGHVYRCDVTVNADMAPELMRSVLLHELGHCLGLGHADSGVMSGGVVPGEEPTPREYRAVACLLGEAACPRERPMLFAFSA